MKKKIKKLSLCLVAGFFIAHAWAQQRSITGVVTDRSGALLPGATIVVKGTTIGTVTDMGGNYSIPNIPENATLRFLFVGMLSQEVVVGNQTTINVAWWKMLLGLRRLWRLGMVPK